jgi:hypothetical protein
MRRRFLDAHGLARRIQESQLVEGFVAHEFPRQVDAVLFDDVRMLRDTGVHVGDRRRGKLELVQTDEQLAVGHDAVRMLPGVGGPALRETEPLVESDGLGDVRRPEADFVEPS